MTYEERAKAAIPDCSKGHLCECYPWIVTQRQAFISALRETEIERCTSPLRSEITCDTLVRDNDALRAKLTKAAAIEEDLRATLEKVDTAKCVGCDAPLPPRGCNDCTLYAYDAVGYPAPSDDAVEPVARAIRREVENGAGNWDDVARSAIAAMQAPAPQPAQTFDEYWLTWHDVIPQRANDSDWLEYVTGRRCWQAALAQPPQPERDFNG